MVQQAAETTGIVDEAKEKWVVESSFNNNFDRVHARPAREKNTPAPAPAATPFFYSHMNFLTVRQQHDNRDNVLLFWSFLWVLNPRGKAQLHDTAYRVP